MLVWNPRTGAGARARVALPAIERVRGAVAIAASIETRGDGLDAERTAAALRATQVQVAIAAGGDGTVGVVVEALLRVPAERRPALGIVALGTGNNAARSLGLDALREGATALERSIGAIVSGSRRAIDVGRVDGRAFLGSFALGLDAAILARRNRLHQRLGRVGARTGYGLYLASFALSFLAGNEAIAGRLVLDGEAETVSLYDLVVANAPIYAGPLRFDAANDTADGLLDVVAIASAREYLREYPRAWLRHSSVLRGAAATPSLLLRRARSVEIELAEPAPSLADGEELPPRRSHRIDVLPGAIRVCVAPLTRSAAGDRSP